MKKTLLFLLFAITFNVQAQHNHSKCGLSIQDQDALKQRILDNRRQFGQTQIANQANKRTTTWVPITIHNVADASGNGRMGELAIISMLCDLNALYATQNIQFYLKGTIRNLNNSFIDNDAWAFQSSIAMAQNKVANSLNMYIGRSTNNQQASFYSGAGDFVFILQIMMDPGAKTEGHEVGHFFTLPHTFYGWEGIDAEADYGGQNAPNSVGGRQTENVARTGGQANCNNAGDGFCDTPADYYSDRESCPYNVTVKDRFGNSLDPDETNVMSYALDACVNQFSNDQKSAISADLMSRGWTNFQPISSAVITTAPAVVSPQDGGQLGDVTNPTVRLEWTPISGANRYYIEVYNMAFVGVWIPLTNSPVYKGIIYSTNSYYNLSTNGMQAGKRYAWKVKAMSDGNTCAPMSGTYTFEAVGSVTTDIKDLPVEKQMSLTVNNNPITASDIPLSIYSAEDVVATVKIYSMSGKEVIILNKQTINEGDNLIQIPAQDIPNGMYVAVLSTDRGSLQQKFIIQR